MAAEPEQQRAADLRRMKRVATGMFAAVTALFVVARLAADSPLADAVEAFAGAAMVGALADWFAVTALFRHPLGLPIPHTAIVPRRKDQIGASLGEFVETNFLTRELLDERLARADAARRIGEWLADPEQAVRAGRAAADAVGGALDVLDDAAIAGSLEQLVERRIRATTVTPLAGRAIELAIEDGHHRRLLDGALIAVSRFLDDHRTTFRSRLQRESPWWIPEPVDERIFNKLFDGVHRFLGEVRADPAHPVRASIDDRLRALAVRLRDDPVMLAKGEELKEELLAHPDVRAWIASLWGELRTSLERSIGDPDSELRRRMTEGLHSLGLRLRDDPQLRAKIDGWIADVGAYLVDNYRGEVSRLIAGTVERWDAESTSRRMELQVGRDLQFIRINGTLVGGLAGLAIHFVTTLF